MIILGVVLIALGAGFAAAAVVGGWGSQAHPVNFAIATVSDWTTAAVFLAGMAAMLVLALGIYLLLRGSHRRARRWRTTRAQRREQAQLAGERDTTRRGKHAAEPTGEPEEQLAPGDADAGLDERPRP